MTGKLIGTWLQRLQAADTVDKGEVQPVVTDWGLGGGLTTSLHVYSISVTCHYSACASLTSPTLTPASQRCCLSVKQSWTQLRCFIFMTTCFAHSPLCSLALTLQWLLRVQSIPTLFPISRATIGCLRRFGHMTVLVCGGSFLMRQCCLTHCLYSDHSSSPSIHSHSLCFPVTRCSGSSLTHSLSLFANYR